MDIEIRSENLAVVSGYVNAVERLSKPISLYGRRFRERIKAGVFAAAIKKAKDEERSIVLKIDHGKSGYTGSYADTKEGSLELKEDNIGLWAKAEIRDENVIADMKKTGVKGWSFGMHVLKSAFGKNEGEDEEIRNVSEIDLNEVTILIHKRPAYSANSIEVRDEEEDSAAMEIRGVEDEHEPFAPEENRDNNEDQKGITGLYKLKNEVLRMKGEF